MRKRDLKNLVGLIVLLVAAFQIITTQPNLLPQNTLPSPSPKPTSVLGQSTTIASDSAEITRVVDGDTIRVFLKGESTTIRMIGINTPESVDPRREVECFGKEASNRLKEILEGKTVTLESDETQDNRDRYGRLLRYVWFEGMNINKQMITDGYAYEYTYDAAYKYQKEFKAAQTQAQEAKRGLWAEDTCGGQK